MSGASLGSAGGAEPGQQHSFAPPGWETRGSAAAPGLEAGKVLWSNRAVTVAGKSKGRANNQAELSLLHLYFLSGLCQSVGPGNLLMVKEKCVFTVLKVDLMGSFVM